MVVNAGAHNLSVSGVEITLSIPENGTVQDLILEMRKKQGIPSSKQRFSVEGKVLEPSETLKSYGVGGNSGSDSKLIDFQIQTRGGGHSLMLCTMVGTESVEVKIYDGDQILDLIEAIRDCRMRTGGLAGKKNLRIEYNGEKYGIEEKRVLRELEFSESSEAKLLWDEEE